MLLKDYGTDYYVCSYISNGIDEIPSDVNSFSVGTLSDYVKFQVRSIDSYKPSTLEAKVSIGYTVGN